MTSRNAVPAGLNALLDDHDAVIDTGSARAYLSLSELRWRIRSGRWQQPCRGVIVAHSGPLTAEQRQRIAVLWGGPGAMLAGLTAARLHGLHGFDRDPETIHLLRPGARVTRGDFPDLDIVVHYSRFLGEYDVEPLRSPRRTRAARSLVDAAGWMPTDRGAQAVLAAGVQQGLVTPEALLEEVARKERLPRGRVIRAAIDDIAGGSQALSELDFLNNVVRAHNLPVPDRQVAHRDSGGRRRMLDAVYEEARLVVEIDGAGHREVLQYWDDMSRDRNLALQGYTILRFPGAMVRDHPREVARQIREALANPRLPTPA